MLAPPVQSAPPEEPEPVPVETATQATTNNPDEVVVGKTIAMSAIDFEQMLRDQQQGKD